MRLVMPSVPLLLSFNGGYVDTAGFLALQGLFTAHVTGNFVTLGASLVFGTSGAMAKLLALPVFCVVIVVTRLLSFGLPHLKLPVLRTMFGLQALLLAAGAAMAIRFGPFPDGDRLTAIMTGMVLVSAMAIQNAAHRIHMSSSPPTTLMTGTTTQIMIDLADRLHGLPAEAAATTRARMSRMAAAVVLFALGAATAALLFSLFGGWCFVLPPAVGMVSLLNSEREGAPIA
jgi:uncharacterized membrane protein YoaK (UPF0700 family)